MLLTLMLLSTAASQRKPGADVQGLGSIIRKAKVPLKLSVVGTHTMGSRQGRVGLHAGAGAVTMQDKLQETLKTLQACAVRC